MIQEFKTMDLPVEPLDCYAGYFIILDVSKCKPYIPEKYLASHDYEDPEKGPAISKLRKNMPDGSVPLDLAFCRWLAVEYGVVVMPNCIFYGRESTTTISYCNVRVAICKTRIVLE